MKKIIYNLFLIFNISFLIIFFVFYFTPENEISYFKSIENKYKLISKANQPKIILIGGSNLPFGVYSPALESLLGRPVVNMGLHAGLGLDFMFRQVLPYINENDVVVVIPEYPHFLENYYYGGEILAQYIIENKKEFTKLSLNNIYNIKEFIFINIQDRYNYLLESYLEKKEMFPSSYSPFYNKLNFNEYGDFIGHLKHFSDDMERNIFQEEDINEKTFVKLDEIEEKIRKKGAYMFFSYPSYSHTSYLKNKKIIENVCMKIENTDIFVISNFKNYLFDDIYLFDTDYHLNLDGVKKRTYLLAHDIKKAIDFKGI